MNPRRSPRPAPVLVLALALVLAAVPGCASGHAGWNGPADPSRLPQGAPMVDLSRYRNVQDRAHQDPDLALAVSLSGGGMRVANYATGILLGLERIAHGESNLLNEVDYFSTVSGSGLAAGVYISERFAHRDSYVPSGHFYEQALHEGCAPGGARRRVAPGCTLRVLERSYLSLVQRLRPGFGERLEDRIAAWALGGEKHPSGAGERAGGLTLGDLFPDAYGPDPVLPFWVANATVYSNGAIFAFTPDVLRAYGVTHWLRGSRAVPLVEPEALPVAAAVKASLSFPVAIPGSSLGVAGDDSPGFIRLVDGGLADNLGYFTAAHLLCQDRPGRGGSGGGRRVLLVVDAFPKDGSPYEPRARPAAALASLVRSPRIPVDGGRLRHPQLLSLMAARCGFTPIVVGFDDLIDNRASAMTPEDRAACGEIARLPPEALSAALDSAALAELGRRSRSVATRLESSAREQEQLILAGRLSACMIRSRLLRAVTGGGVHDEVPPGARLLYTKSR
jgi:hypothetical protein